MKYIVFVAGLLFSLLAGEMIIRGLGLAPQIHRTEADRYVLSENPLIGYELAPGYSHHGFRVNSHGLRDREYFLNKPECVYRIVVLGDSISDGTLIHDEESLFHSLVEKALNHGLRDDDLICEIEIINFGVGGYNTLQEAHTLRDKAIHFSPDLVLIQYTLNDEYVDDGGLGFNLLKEVEETGVFTPSRSSKVLLASHLYRFVRFRVFGQGFKERWQRLKAGREYLASKNHVEEAFELIGETTAEAEIPVLVVVFPAFDKGLEPYPFTDQHRTVHELAEKHGFQSIDLLECFRDGATNTSVQINIDHVHPSETGHQLVASLLEDELWDRYISENLN
jgi:lysophospholipase L1-like esterase